MYKKNGIVQADPAVVLDFTRNIIMNHLWDTHMHTSFSGDSEADPEAMIREAVRLGLSGICITDHEDLDYPDPDICFELDLPVYEQTILDLKKKYAGKIPVCFGIELGLAPHLTERHRQILSSHPFDFVIGSSHLVNGIDPYYPAYYEGRSEEEAYREYFRSVLANIQAFQDFDVYGHLDYVVRYGPDKNRFYSYERYADVIDPILMELIRLGKGIEVNTAGFKYGLGHPNPTEAILCRYRELGGTILTLGADAHAPEQIAWSYASLPGLLKDCGFDSYTVFQNRKPIFLPL